MIFVYRKEWICPECRRQMVSHFSLPSDVNPRRICRIHYRCELCGLKRFERIEAGSIKKRWKRLDPEIGKA